VREASLATERALFDFDVVVIRPYLLVGTRPGGPWAVESGPFHRAEREMTAKQEDLVRLLTQGGLLIVILDAVQELKFNTGRHAYMGGTVYTATNYDFLSRDFFHCIRNGTGRNVEILNTADPFSTVLRNSEVEWTAYIASGPPDPFSHPEYFARNGAKSYIGGFVSLGSGNVIVLPNFKNLNQELFFEACREYRYAREGTPPPDWCTTVFMPGVPEAEVEINAIEDRLCEVEQSKRRAIEKRDDLLAYKKLLYEKGKTQLEPTVRRAVDLIGFKSTSSEIVPPNFEIDGRTTVGSLPGILEIKGSKKQIGLDELSSFVPKILADLQANGFQSKGVLIGNGLCEAKPLGRMGSKPFSSHAVDAAKMQSVALINSVELYCVACRILSGQVVTQDLELIRERILKTSGFVSLTEFCGEPPFPNI
jgi:hypothetical protein